MFDSLPAPLALRRLRGLRPPAASDALPGGGAWGARLFPPVLATVRGGYTVSGLEGYGDDSSPESLVRCGAQ